MRSSIGSRNFVSTPTHPSPMWWDSRSDHRPRCRWSSKEPEQSMADDLDLEDFADTAVGDVRDPYPEYADRRRNHPVEVVEFYFQKTHKVYRYADIDAILRQPEVFTS